MTPAALMMIRHGAVVIAMLASLASGAKASDFVADGPTPENSEATAGEITKCYAKHHAFGANVPLAALRAAGEECDAQATGVTLSEYFAFSSGCWTLDDERRSLCSSGVDKLRPMFPPVAKDAALAPRNLKPDELLAMESGCPRIRLDLERQRCLVGISKLKAQILPKSQMTIVAPVAASQPNPLTPGERSAGDPFAKYGPIESIAGQFEDGRAAFARRDYATALRLWTRLAEHGDAPAQNNLGAMYRAGQGAPQDFPEAVEWFRKAAAQNNADAQSNLGEMYEAGQGAPQNYVEAMKWYHLAANQANGPGEYGVGTMYFYGEGVLRNDAEAAKWFRLAASENYTPAQSILGFMYQSGRGVPQDDAEAVKWVRLAADKGYAVAQLILGGMYFFGDGVPQDYVESMKWYRAAAEQGNADAQESLGLSYDAGLGAPQDYVLAHMWLNLSAAQGDQIALSNRDELVKRMTPEQIAEAQKLAREWRPIPQSPPKQK